MPASNPPERVPTIDDVRDAAIRIHGKAIRTPLMESPVVNALTGGRVLVKAEPLQRTGSFKFRGAYNKLSRLSPDELAVGVVTDSSGNHAQGIAAVAQLLGAPATIIMPSSAPQNKVERTRAYGAEIVFYERGEVDAEVLTQETAKNRGATLIPSFDDPYIIAGHGTVGLEIAVQAKDAEASLDAVLVPCGGGGLVSGVALAFAAASPATAVYAVEPAGFDCMTRSLAEGEPIDIPAGAHSICDAILSLRTRPFTFAICQKLLAGGIAADDEAVQRAMNVAFSEFKLVVEPGGSVALAAALEQKIAVKGQTVAVVCSGGNVDSSVFNRAIAS
jgi:threonine dehydratase